MDLAIIAAIGFSEGTVILTPPSAAFATFLDVEMAVNGHHPVAVAPLTQTDAIDNQGWLKRTFGAREASASLTGVGRVATPNEVANGEAADNTYQNPWVTPELLKPALDARMITSGVGVEVASNKTNLRIDALEPATALAPSDVLPLYQAAPPRHRRASLGALRDYFTVAHDDTLAGLGTAASPLGVAGVRPRAWVYFDGNQIIASAGFLAAEKFGGGGVKLYFSTPMPDANYAVIGTGMQNAAEIRVLLELRGMRSADAFAVQTAWQITSTTWADFSPFSLVVFR